MTRYNKQLYSRLLRRRDVIIVCRLITVAVPQFWRRLVERAVTAVDGQQELDGTGVRVVRYRRPYCTTDRQAQQLNTRTCT